MDLERVGHAYEALLEDVERVGPLPRAHVVSVASRRDLDADEAARLLKMLAEAGAMETAVRPTSEASDGVPSQAPSPREGVGVEIEVRYEMPAKLGKHPVMRADQEVFLGRQIQMGLQASAALDRGEDSSELRQLAEDGDTARHTMIVNNYRLILEIAKSFVPQSGDLEFEDLVQEGVRGLNRAAEKFDPNLGYKFSTYATWWIRQAISRAIADTSTAVRLPVHVWEQWRQIVRYQKDYETRNGRPPSLTELAAGTDKDPSIIRAIIDFASPLVHLDTVVSDSPEGVTLGELMPSEAGASVEQQVLDAVMLRAIEARIEEIAEGYDPRFLRILEGRLGLHGHEQVTLEQLGAEFRITRERVRQLEKRILKMIQEDPVLANLVRDHLEDCYGAA